MQRRNLEIETFSTTKRRTLSSKKEKLFVTPILKFGAKSGSLGGRAQKRFPGCESRRMSFKIEWLECVRGCLPFTKKIRKFRLECKWKDEISLPKWKISGENGISWKVDQNSQTEFPNGNNCAFHSLFLISSRPFGFDRLTTVSGTANPVWKFPFGFWRFPFTIPVDKPGFLISLFTQGMAWGGGKESDVGGG